MTKLEVLELLKKLTDDTYAVSSVRHNILREIKDEKLRCETQPETPLHATLFGELRSK